MDELVQQGLAVLRGMWHRRWIGLAAAWVVAIVVVTIALRVPDRYEAAARVYVDTQTLLRPLMEGLSIQPNLEQQVVLLSRTLISRPNVEKVVRMADLDLATTSVAARDDLIDSVGSGLRLGGGTSPIFIRSPFATRTRTRRAGSCSRCSRSSSSRAWATSDRIAGPRYASSTIRSSSTKIR